MSPSGTEHRAEDTRRAQTRARHHDRCHRAVLGTQRHLRGEEGIPRRVDENRPAGDDARRERASGPLQQRLSDGGTPDRERPEGTQGTGTSPEAAAQGLRHMKKLSVGDLFSLERYARERPAFRTRVLEHKRDRQLAVGPHVTWLVEDCLTDQHQVQGMLRAERIFEPEGVEEELESYNPLIPDGQNWKVTLLIEFPDEQERRRQLMQLKGIERRCWVQAAGLERVY